VGFENSEKVKEPAREPSILCQFIHENRRFFKGFGDNRNRREIFEGLELTILSKKKKKNHPTLVGIPTHPPH
jgi:hypothetical protein